MSVNFQLMGKRVKEQRLRRHLKQEDLAWKAEIAVSYLSLIENGRKEASLKAIIRIAEVLNVTEAYLLFGVTLKGQPLALMELSVMLTDCEESEQNFIMYTVIATAEAVKKQLKGNGSKYV